MTRLILALSSLLALTSPPAVKPLDDDYVAVRRDVFLKLEAADANLPGCEATLSKAQDELRRAQVNIAELKSAADELVRQKATLESHVTRLETVITRYEDYTRATDANLFEKGWEQMDGAVGVAAGYALGTGMCVGLAWVFNQPAFGGSAP